MAKTSIRSNRFEAPPKSRREKLNAFFFTVVKFAIGWNRNPPRSNIASRSSSRPRDARRRSARTEGPAKRGDFNAPQSERRSDLFSRFCWNPTLYCNFFFFLFWPLPIRHEILLSENPPHVDFESRRRAIHSLKFEAVLYPRQYRGVLIGKN